MTKTAPGNRRRGGRRGKLEDRAEVRPAAPYVVRKVPPYEILSEESLVRIEEKADILLQEIGMEFRNDPETLRIWKDAGADVKGERVRFERGLCRDIIQRSAPCEFLQHARNPERTVRFGGDALVFGSAYGPPFVQSLDFPRRYATIEDFNTFVKLTHLSPHLHHASGVICEPTDVPIDHRHLDMALGHLKYSDKPFMGAVTAPERAEDSIDMAEIAFGKEFVAKNCCVLGLISINSPFVFDGTMTRAMKVYARRNQGILLSPFVIAGASGVVTPAGALAQSLAEMLPGLALSQLYRPGTPIIFGFMMNAINMRTGSAVRFDETWKGLVAAGQLVRRLGLPFRCGGASTSSKIPDIHAGMEGALYLTFSVLSGANFIVHATGTCETGLSISFEKYLLDCEMLGALSGFLGGVDTGDDEFGIEAYRAAGPGGTFLDTPHTIARYKSAFFESPLFDSGSYEQWLAEGSTDAAQKANALMKENLAAYEPPPLDTGVEEALEDFVRRRKSELPVKSG
jgi:trimethylamine---corrinoid protein Co-methyltransferase